MSAAQGHFRSIDPVEEGNTGNPRDHAHSIKWRRPGRGRRSARAGSRATAAADRAQPRPGRRSPPVGRVALCDEVMPPAAGRQRRARVGVQRTEQAAEPVKQSMSARVRLDRGPRRGCRGRQMWTAWPTMIAAAIVAAPSVTFRRTKRNVGRPVSQDATDPVSAKVRSTTTRVEATRSRKGRK